MKKQSTLFLTLVLCLLSLAGCKALEISTDFDPDNELSKAQKIVVADAGGSEKAILETKEDIDAFVEAVNVEGWRLAELPADLVQEGSFTIWQTETVTALLGKRESEMKEICAFLIYEDGDYLTIDTGFAGIAITFSIPETTSEYLHDLVQ